MKVTTVGLDLANNVFQIHRITDKGNVVFNKATGFARDVVEGAAPDIPEIGQDVIRVLCRQLLSTDYLVRWHDLRLQAVALADRQMKLTQTIPGILRPPSPGCRVP